jgi:hypothetical protein
MGLSLVGVREMASVLIELRDDKAAGRIVEILAGRSYN